MSSETLTLATEQSNIILRELASRDDDELFFNALNANSERLARCGINIVHAYPTLAHVSSHRIHKNNKSERLGIFKDDKFAGVIDLYYDFREPPAEYIANRDYPSAELGYWLDESMEGMGIATFAVRAVSRFALQRLPSVYARVLCDNTKSSRVLSRSGFKLVANHPGINIYRKGMFDKEPDEDPCQKPLVSV